MDNKVIKSYKGFNEDMTCRGFQFEEGKEYEQEGEIKACNSGFHACEYPLDCFGYYEPSKSVFHEVEQSGDISKHANDSKIASSKIKIGARLNFAGIVKASIEYVRERATKKCKGSCLRSDKSVASNSGDSSVASNSGDSSVASNSGKDGVSVGWGRDNKCKGVKGSYLVLSEWGEWDGEKYPLINATMVKVDGETIKEDTFYALKGGKIVEAD